MEPKSDDRRSSALIGGAVLSLGLASFAAAQDPLPQPIEPPPAQSTVDPIKPQEERKIEPAVPSPDQGVTLDNVNLDSTELGQVTRALYDEIVRFTILPLEGDKRELVFCFVPNKGREPRIIIFQYPSEKIPERVKDYLEKKDFMLVNQSLGHLLEQVSAVPPEAQPGFSSRTFLLLTKALIYTALPLIIAARYFSGLIRRRSAQQSIARDAERGSTNDSEPTVCRYEIKGEAQPQLCFKLAPGEVVFAQKGSLLRRLSTISATLDSGRALGFTSAASSMGKSLLSGESLYYQCFKNQSTHDAELVLGPSKLGQVLGLNLSEYPAGLSASNGAFFAATPGVKMQVDGKAGWKGLFSGTGMFQQRFSGTGHVFLFTAGTLECVTVSEGETIIADSDTIFAWENGVNVELKRQSVADTALSGEGLVVAQVSGKGKAWFATRGASDDKSGGGIISNLFHGFFS